MINKSRKEYHKKYYESKVKPNPEAKAKRAEYYKKWASENKEKVKAYQKAHRDREKLRIIRRIGQVQSK